jgi:AraC family transcriptional regulator of adaptative response/methylated-DNA-[protein]-cysteine methyltransferase
MEDYERIEQVIRYVEKNFRSQPSLEEISNHIALSPYHTQRLFKRWAGISPKRFVQFLTLEYAKTVLDETGSLLEAAWDSGLSGTSRLHDLFVTFDAVTPGEFKCRGERLDIHLGFHPSPFGRCLLGVTARGICWLSFFGSEGPEPALIKLKRLWPGADYRDNPRMTEGYMNRIFPHRGTVRGEPLTLFLKGTNFQIKVWEALLRLPPGGLSTYSELASSIGRSEAVRAVASAIARNPVSYLIPCHRVLRKSGRVSGYRWGQVRKKALIAWEAANIL